MSDVTLILQNDLEIDESLANAVRYRVLQRIPELEYDRSYALKTICGPEFWKHLTTRERIVSGRYMAHLVSIGELPLAFDVCPHQSNKRYRLK